MALLRTGLSALLFVPLLTGTARAGTDFEPISQNEFQSLRDNGRSEFLGCACVKTQTGWEPWQFVVLNDDGFRAKIGTNTFRDVEQCAAKRDESQTLCGVGQ